MMLEGHRRHLRVCSGVFSWQIGLVEVWLVVANIDSEKTASKRSRKKKTLAELRDEQILLLKERRELKREISAVNENLERQRARNATLKRMKIELLPAMGCVAKEATRSHHKPESSGQLSISRNDHGDPEKHTVALAASDPTFILPDLNIPFDEPKSETITGVSQLDLSKFLGK